MVTAQIKQKSQNKTLGGSPSQWQMSRFNLGSLSLKNVNILGGGEPAS